MSPEHRQYVLRETAASLVINTVLSVGFALLIARGHDAIPLWGAGGMAVDFIPQTFMIVLATTIAVTLIARKRIRAGAVQPLPLSAAGPFARTPRHVVLRALLIAGLAAIALTPLSAGVLHALGISSLPSMSFVTMKALYGAGLTLVLAPLIVRAALAFEP